MMKYEARYEEFVNKRYKEPEDGNFADATREILEAVPGDDSNISDDEEMEPVADTIISDFSKFAKIR